MRHFDSPNNFPFSTVMLSGLNVTPRRGNEDCLAIASYILKTKFNFVFPPADVRRAWRLNRKRTSPILLR